MPHGPFAFLVTDGIKLAATFYRGMGEGFVPKVLREGLPEGVFMSTDPEIAHQYAGVGADNVLRGDHLTSPQYGDPTPKYTERMKALGFSDQSTRFMKPNSVAPKGAVLKITVPDDAGLTQPGAVSDLSEHIAKSRIAPEYIEILSAGHSPAGNSHAQSATRMTPGMLRLAEKAKKRGVDIRQLISDSRTVAPYPQPWTAEDNADYLRQARAYRREMEKNLRAAAAGKYAPPVVVNVSPGATASPPPPKAETALPKTSPVAAKGKPSFDWRHPAVLGAGALGLAGLGYGAYQMFRGNKKPKEDKEEAA